MLHAEYLAVVIFNLNLQFSPRHSSDILYKYPWVVCERWWDGGIFWWWYPGQQLLCSYDEPDSRATANGRLGFTKVKKKLTCLFDENIFCKTNNKVKRATGPKYEVRSPTLLPVQILSFVKPKVSCWSAASKCLCSTFYLLGRVVFIRILSPCFANTKIISFGSDLCRERVTARLSFCPEN